MHQCNRISPARNPNEHRRARRDSRALKRRGNNIEHNISKFATHEMRLFPPQNRINDADSLRATLLTGAKRRIFNSKVQGSPLPKEA